MCPHLKTMFGRCIRRQVQQHVSRWNQLGPTSSYFQVKRRKIHDWHFFIICMGSSGIFLYLHGNSCAHLCERSWTTSLELLATSTRLPFDCHSCCCGFRNTSDYVCL